MWKRAKDLKRYLNDECCSDCSNCGWNTDGRCGLMSNVEQKDDRWRLDAPDIANQQKTLIVTVDYGDKRCIRIASYHDLRGMPKHYRCGGAVLPEEKVKAWMPLPKPYEE